MAYGVIESANMASTKYAEHIYDAVNATTDIENGTVGYITPTEATTGVIYPFTKGTNGIKATSILVIVDQPAWDYDTCKITNQRLDKFIIKAGTPFRVRGIAKNDVIALNEACFESDAVTAAAATAGIVGGSLKIAKNSTTGKFSLSSATTVTLDAESKLVVAVEAKRIEGATIVSTASIAGYKKTMYDLRVVSVG